METKSQGNNGSKKQTMPNKSKNMELIRKKAFNKQKWREAKHSKKVQIQKRQDERRKALEHRYRKQLKKEGIVLSGTVSERQEKQKTSLIKEAQKDYEELQRARREARKVKEEKRRLIQAMRDKKAERFRKLNQKTKKGQPLMRGRLELLQEKIQRLRNENKL